MDVMGDKVMKMGPSSLKGNTCCGDMITFPYYVES